MQRKTIILLTTAVLLAAGCKKSSDTRMTDAVITGYDYRKCACCGGLMINFNNDPEPYSGSFYQVHDLPANAGISEQTSFPLYVRVTWQPVEGGCGNSINILRLDKK